MSDLLKCDGPFGRIEGEAGEVYHANPAISKSKLCDFIASPAYFRGRHLTREVVKEETPALRFGHLYHYMMEVGPVGFNRVYLVEPDFGYLAKHDASGTTSEQAKANKARRDEWRAANPGWESRLITPAEYAALHAMHKSVVEHPIACDLVCEGTTEVTYRVKPDALPFAVQARPDLENFKGRPASGGQPYLLDFKSIDNLTTDYTPEQLWKWAVVDRKYYIQDTWYFSVLDLCGVPTADLEFYFVVTEKKYPFATAVYSLGENFRMAGRRTIKTKVEELKRCVETNTWPTTPGTICEVDADDYELRKLIAA